ncbi:SNF2 family N-terminal domain-containing protein [Rhexocercosporidium sp. MPI-PUGE-AT-0058]|nr:SNF2 family N-terminal domain-containing protein [Rhexocercosporidium sp. MPI-PUGE-AT-0058]
MESHLGSREQAAEARGSKRRRLNGPNDHQIHLSCFQHSNHNSPQTIPYPDSQYNRDENLPEYLEGGAESDSEHSNWHNDSGAAVGDCQFNFQKCCYGMLANIPVRLGQNYVESSKTNPVVFEQPNILRTLDKHAQQRYEITNPLHVSILEQLESINAVETQLYCQARDGVKDQTKSRRGQKNASLWSLNVILYGPPALEEGIGHFLSQYRTYLQDPIGCERRVPYRNPHIIPPETEDVMMTDSLECPLGNLGVERLEVGPDLLAELMNDKENLEETEASESVTTSLFPLAPSQIDGAKLNADYAASHQKQALTFMLRREQGWQLDGCRDVWTARRDAFGRVSYTNNIAGHAQGEPPAGFQGGLLADDMGLGKTLSMICLIAADVEAADSFLTPPMTPNNVGRATVKTTLLIVPPPLIQSWQKQFRVHLKQKPLSVFVFHGQKKKVVDKLGQYNVVITTYHTVSSLWRKGVDAKNVTDSIFSIDWHRIVLDEAHTIQNPQSHLAQACCALRSGNRWAITGTPIQNKLTDFASIVKFLRVYPYNKQENFDEHISRPWRRGDDQGYLRLKILVRAITIARSKAVVDLPQRQDFIHHLDFTTQELRMHEDTKRQTVALLQDTISCSGPARTTFNALQRLNTLRLICSHGQLAQFNILMQTPGQNLSGPSFQADPSLGCSEGVLEGLVGGYYSCSQCGMDLLQDVVEDTPDLAMLKPASFSARSDICISCTTEAGLTPNRPCNVRDDVEMANSPMSMTSSSSLDAYRSYPRESMPTKIKALVADLTHYSPVEKRGVNKTVVFSYWTYTLDLIQIMLDDSGILYTRIDGRTSLSKRTRALRSFEKDNSLRVILVSITCGGAGLDLTAASRAYLMEPHWNPMIEEQALCRVHRVGQKRSVTTIRYLMRDSFEEQVIEIQKRKKLLAKVTFGQDPLEESGIGMSTLQYLKSVLE